MIIDAHVTLHEKTKVTHLLEEMKFCNIGLSVLAPEPREYAFANDEGNMRLATVCQENQSLKFWAVATPWSAQEGLGVLKRAIVCGAVGVAFDSSVQGFSLLGREIRFFLDFLGEFDLPLYFHTGTPVNALPLQLATLAKSYPNLKFIMGRSGRTDFRTDALPAMQISQNIFADTSHDYPNTGLLNMYKAMGSQRMIFTSDSPFETQEFGLKCVSNIPISKEEKDQILGLNFMSLLGEAEL